MSRRKHAVKLEVLRERLDGWTTCVENVARGSGAHVCYDEYLNDMDSRRKIGHELESLAGTIGEKTMLKCRQKMEAADALLREATVETAECIWGEDSAIKNGWSRPVNWYYDRRPRITLPSDSGACPEPFAGGNQEAD